MREPCYGNWWRGSCGHARDDIRRQLLNGSQAWFAEPEP
jgi:hypothetical protein